MKLLKINHLLLWGVCACSQMLNAQDAAIRLETTSADVLSFRVFYGGREVIGESPLGMTIDNKAIGKNVRIKSVTPDIQMDDGKSRTYTIEKPEGEVYYVDTREYADGIALRYRIPTSTNICIYDEATSFTFPSRTKTWYASGPFQYGWLQEFRIGLPMI